MARKALNIECSRAVRRTRNLKIQRRIQTLIREVIIDACGRKGRSGATGRAASRIAVAVSVYDLYDGVNRVAVEFACGLGLQMHKRARARECNQFEVVAVSGEGCILRRVNVGADAR